MSAHRRRWRAALLVLALGAAAASPWMISKVIDPPAAADPPTHGGSVPLRRATPAQARRSLAELGVADRYRRGYRRELFGDGWATHHGCSVRQHVLADEMVEGSRRSCWIEAGRWRDWYSNGSPIIDADTVEVDHLVPLGHAWQSGAHAWSPRRRVAFANDLSSPWTLSAVSAAANGAKSASPPDAWQPAPAARCAYALDWIAVKDRGTSLSPSPSGVRCTRCWRPATIGDHRPAPRG